MAAIDPPTVPQGVWAMTDDRARSCDGKRRYDTYHAARVAVIKVARQQHDETIHVYKCAFCGAFHIGHRRAAWQR
jgi:hypothetical protein